jgi:hypothetical protein
LLAGGSDWVSVFLDLFHALIYKSLFRISVFNLNVWVPY